MVERLVLAHALVETAEVLKDIQPGWLVGGLFSSVEIDDRGPTVQVSLSGASKAADGETFEIWTSDEAA